MSVATLGQCFLGLLVLVAGLLALGMIHYLPASQARWGLAGLGAWLVYAGLLGWFGVIRDPAVRPPGPALLVGPAVLFVAFVARSAWAGRIAAGVPVALLVGAQVYRVGVEFTFHELWHAGLAPRMLTFEGANIDIAIGITAPIVAVLYSMRRIGRRTVLAWNAVGLIVLANVVVRSALTAPGPLNLIHAEIPNLALGTSPFNFIPGFFAPLAIVLHVLAIRATRTRSRLARTSPETASEAPSDAGTTIRTGVPT